MFEWNGWRLGLLICYDVEFPEAVRGLALQGADAVLVPTANMMAFDEVPNLLVDISQTGLAAGLEEKLFQPQGENKKDFYAELPIKIRLTGGYHEMGEFASGIAALPRIVTLNDISIGVPAKDKDKLGGNLSMDATARTFRYLDGEEVQAQRKAAAAGDNVAHFAHLGGMLFAVILLLIWRQKRDSFY